MLKYKIVGNNEKENIFTTLELLSFVKFTLIRIISVLKIWQLEF